MPPSAALLTEWASQYIWWKLPAEAIQMPERVVAQVMNIGAYEDVQTLAECVGDDYLRHILHTAEIGQFNARSWAYWHYRLGWSSSQSPPPMPVRCLG